MSDISSYILSRESLGDFRSAHGKECIVFTNGCFDVIHRGHVELLRRARGFGDVLVVGVNSDRSVRRLKGEGRPLIGEEDRVFILLNIRSVDYVTVFDEDTPMETVKALEPDVLVKGAEYSLESIVGAGFVLDRGGRVERVEMMENRSTSALIDRIRGDA